MTTRKTIKKYKRRVKNGGGLRDWFSPQVKVSEPQVKVSEPQVKVSEPINVRHFEPTDPADFEQFKLDKINEFRGNAEGNAEKLKKLLMQPNVIEDLYKQKEQEMYNMVKGSLIAKIENIMYENQDYLTPENLTNLKQKKVPYKTLQDLLSQDDDIKVAQDISLLPWQTYGDHSLTEEAKEFEEISEDKLDLKKLAKIRNLLKNSQNIEIFEQAYRLTLMKHELVETLYTLYREAGRDEVKGAEAISNYLELNKNTWIKNGGRKSYRRRNKSRKQRKLRLR
jgi:hypothetical protein